MADFNIIKSYYFKSVNEFSKVGPKDTVVALEGLLIN